MAIKLRKADKVFSLWIKRRDGFTCQRCGAKHEEGSRGLHCAHFITRRNEATRFDPDNTDSICYGCHSFFHQHPEEHRKWKADRLGPELFFELTTIRKRTIVKKDDKAVILKYKEEL